MTSKVTVSPNCPPLLSDVGNVSDICARPERWEQATMIHSGRNRVILFTDPDTGHRYVIKSYKKPNIVQRIAYTWFKPGKARRAYDYAAKLRERGISTPREVACIETYSHGLLAHSYFVSDYCPWPSLASLWLPVTPYEDAQIELLAQTLVDMHRAGVLHGDTNIGNFLYSASQVAITTVDVNRSRFLDREPSPKECLDNLVRLTHRRDILYKVTELYALKRGWNQSESAEYVVARLVEYEKKRNRHNKLKHITP